MVGPMKLLVCPACRSDRIECEYEVSAVEAAQHFVIREENETRHSALVSNIARLWRGPKCALRQCRECGFGFADPFVAGDEEFYNLAYEFPDYPRYRWEYGRTSREMSELNLPVSAALEVGAGYGDFIDRIVARGFDKANIVALEYNDRSLEVLKGKGYNALKGDLRSISFERKFGAIFMFQVLEHMSDLEGLFEKLSDMLEVGGVAFIAVPNARRTEFDERNGSLMDMPPNHVGRWSASAFRKIGLRHGLRMDRLETEPFSLVAYINQDIVYSYRRRAQRGGSIENWARSRRRGAFGRLVEAIVAAVGALGRIPVWMTVSSCSDLGGSVWVKYVKND